MFEVTESSTKRLKYRFSTTNYAREFANARVSTRKFKKPIKR